MHLQGQEKMSKSDPNSAIFMEDAEAEVKTKLKKAFCPPQVGMSQLKSSGCQCTRARMLRVQTSTTFRVYMRERERGRA